MQLANLGLRLLYPNRGKDETATGRRVIAIIPSDSNGRGNNTTVGPDATAWNVEAWNDGANATYKVTNTDLIEPVAASATGSQWPSFGIEYNTLTGKVPVICDCGVGGTRWHSGTASVSWDTSGSLWPDALAKTNRCLNYLGLDKPWAVYINLGINDAAQDSYTMSYSVLQTSINRINTAWNFPRIFIVLIGKANESNYTNNQRIFQMNKYIKQLAHDYANVELCTSMRNIVSWGGNIQVDDFHMNATGNDLHGRMVARQMAFPTTWSKYTRFAAGSFYNPISDTRKGFIQTLVNDLGPAIWEYDELRFWSNCAADDRNVGVDFAGLAPTILAGSPTVGYDGVVTNGTSQYLSVGPQSLIYDKSSESDFINAVRMGTVSSAAGGADRAAIGIRENVGITLLNQRSVSQLGVLAAATSGDLTASETKFANNAWYGAFRSGGDHGITKDAAIVLQATRAMVAHAASSLRGKAYGAYNNNTTVQQHLAAQFLAAIQRKYTTMNLSTEFTALNNFCSNWFTNIT